MSGDREIAVVAGVGPGLGSALVRCFAGQGMRVACVARTAERLADLAQETGRSGLFLRPHGREQRRASLRAHRRRTGCAVSGASQSELVCDEAVSRAERGRSRGGVAHRVLRRVPGRPGGGARHADRRRHHPLHRLYAFHQGGSRFAAFAAAKFGLRALSQSMARELGSQGIHVAHVVVDGPIEGPGNEGLTIPKLSPDDIAQAFLALHRQHRSAWTQELDIRPAGAKF